MTKLAPAIYPRFSLRSLLAWVTLAAVVMAFGRHGLRHGFLAALIILLLLIWYYDESRPPNELKPFPWPLFIWTGIKSVLGGLFMAMAAAQLFEPIFAAIQPTFENIFSRCVLKLHGWSIRQGAMERIEQRLGMVLFCAAWWVALVLIAARPHNIAARWAAPTIVLIFAALQLPEVIQTWNADDDPFFLMVFAAAAVLAFAGGWLGDVLRARREAKILAELGIAYGSSNAPHQVAADAAY